MDDGPESFRPLQGIGPRPPVILTRHQLAKRLTETLLAVLTRCRHRASEGEGDAIEEAVRRLAEHEGLVRHVLPELRNRLTAVETGGGEEIRPMPPLF
jgi:hypothetical protein